MKRQMHMYVCLSVCIHVHAHDTKHTCVYACVYARAQVLLARMKRKAAQVWCKSAAWRGFRRWALEARDARRRAAVLERAGRHWRQRRFGEAWQAWYEYHVRSSRERQGADGQREMQRMLCKVC